MVPCRVEIFKKIDIQNVFSGYEDSPYVFTRLINKVSIDRRLSTNVATANIDIFYAGFNEDLILYQYGGAANKVPIIDNFNKVKIYIDGKIQFYGVISNYVIDDENNVINISCQDMYYHLNRLVDCRVPYIEYRDILIYDLLKDLAHKAGIDGEVVVFAERGDNYKVSTIKIKYDTQISDIFTDASATSNIRVRCLKDGRLAIEDMYHTYNYDDVPKATNYDYDYSYVKRINSSNARRGGDTLYNRLLVRFDGKTYNVYNNTILYNYMCCENKFKEIQTTLGDTPEKRFRIANRSFRNDTRENTTLTIDAVEGNPDLDLGQALKINLDNRIGHYMVTGISTTYAPEGYFDTIDIEGLLPTDFIYCQLSSGNYDSIEEDSSNAKPYTSILANQPGSGIQILSNKSCKMGKFLLEGTEPSINIICEFNNPNAGVSIIDPMGKIIGVEGNPNSPNVQEVLLTKNHGTLAITGLSSCSAITFTDYPKEKQGITISNPIRGTWVIRGKGIPSGNIEATITCTINWTILNETVSIKTY